MTSGLSKLSGSQGRWVHEIGCAALSAPAPKATACEPDPLADIKTQRDDLIQYGLLVRPCYDRLNRVIAQLSGIFILALAHSRFEADFEALTAALRQLDEVHERLRTITPAPLAQQHHRVLLRALTEVQAVAKEFDHSLTGAENTRARILRWTEQLETAHARIRASASTAIGLLPVDFSQACCSCHALNPVA